MAFHHYFRIDSTDRFFVTGGNPDKNGGGVIASSDSLSDAQDIQREAVKRGYTSVRVMTAAQMWACPLCGSDSASPCGCVEV